MPNSHESDARTTDLHAEFASLRTEVSRLRRETRSARIIGGFAAMGLLL
jgi:hypothetical protein